MRCAPYIAPARVEIERRADGSLILTNPHPLRPAFDTVVEPLAYWSRIAPDRLWLAGQEGGQWRGLSYAEGWTKTRALAAGLARRHAPGSVIAIASGNSINHALLTYAAPLAGLAVAPVTPAYSLKARDPRRLLEALSTVRASAVFMEGAAFCKAAGWAEAAGIPVVTAGAGFGTASETCLETLFADPAGAPDHRALDPAATCKLLLTSGSTGAPKAVLVSHTNLAANAAQIRSTFDPALEAEIWPDGIVMANHLPWSHSLGGNAVLHMLLHAGGSLWIDPGSPTQEGLAATIETIKHVRPNYHLTVPLGWSLLAGALEADAALAQALFANLRVMQYGGAALTQDVYARLQAVAQSVTGDTITLAAGYGATETAPTVCNVHWPNAVMGLVGLPVPGLSLKLVPHGDRLEARVKGPGITAGYRGAPEQTAAAFDEEGFYRLGDALRFADPARPEAGLAFDGRLSEEFKLSNGTFVPAGNLRPALVQASDGLFADAVICGEGREDVAALIFLNVARARQVAEAPAADLAALAVDPAVMQAARRALSRAGDGQPVSRRVARAILLASPPSLEDGEITDKGYLNQARCRACRHAEAAALHGSPGAACQVLEA